MKSTRKLIATALLAVGVVGCAKSATLDVSEYLPAEAEVVEAYGMTLDENASPQQVVWVLFQTIREDVAARPGSPEREAALKRLCRLADVEGLRARSADRSDTLNELIFRRINTWSPQLHYYVQYLPDTFEAATANMTVSDILSGDGRKAARVRYTLPGKNNGGPADLDIGVTIRVALTQVSKGYWRVLNVGFDQSPDLAARAAE